VRATAKGRDLLRGVLAASLLSWLLDARVTLVLASTLALTALLSLIILMVAGAREAAVTVVPNRLRGFKGERLTAEVRVWVKNQRWTRIHISSLRLPEGLRGSVAEGPGGAMQLSITPLYAGRYSGLDVGLEVRDLLDLFSRTLGPVNIGISIEALPHSLQKPPALTRPSALALGERPSGAPGSGQELYGVEEYRQAGEAKHILWRRVAAQPDLRLIVKVRESNIRRAVRLGVIEALDRGPARAGWMDMVCEALGEVGKGLIGMGCRVEVVCQSRDRVAVIPASSLDELADAIMEMWSAQSPGRGWVEVVGQADVVVTGMRDIEEPVLATAILHKPAVLIQEPANPPMVGGQALVYSGSEDVGWLVRRVVER